MLPASATSRRKDKTPTCKVSKTPYKTKNTIEKENRNQKSTQSSQKVSRRVFKIHAPRTSSTAAFPIEPKNRISEDASPPNEEPTPNPYLIPVSNTIDPFRTIARTREDWSLTQESLLRKSQPNPKEIKRLKPQIDNDDKEKMQPMTSDEPLRVSDEQINLLHGKTCTWAYCSSKTSVEAQLIKQQEMYGKQWEEATSGLFVIPQKPCPDGTPTSNPNALNPQNADRLSSMKDSITPRDSKSPEFGNTLNKMIQTSPNNSPKKSQTTQSDENWMKYVNWENCGPPILGNIAYQSIPRGISGGFSNAFNVGRPRDRLSQYL
ncbi:hypothetical protein EDC01DRAFT_727513 [Geopyxis carbonaria]|nr:hypothetical protein EDC01DRAFT_727513 [Geopyxis carbonaria]